MCGRFAVSTDLRVIGARFRATRAAELPERHLPRLDIRPTQDVLTIALGANDIRRIVPMRWWLVPAWEKTPATKLTTFNAKAETIGTSQTFGPSFHMQKGKGGRCLIPFDAFYEFTGKPGAKVPVSFSLASAGMPAFAGLWAMWRPKGGTAAETSAGIVLLSCSIVTVPANSLVAAVHDRMPAILDEDAWPLWLGETGVSDSELKGLLRPYQPERMTMTTDRPTA